MHYIAQTVSGSRKKNNEDRIFINGHILANGSYFGSKSDHLLAAVFDGVGGEPGGDYAAAIAAGDCLPINEKKLSFSSILYHLINTNKDIQAAQDNYYYFRKMATTVAGVQISNNEYCIFYLGDTRIYKYENGELIQMTKDHTLAERKLLEGNISSIEQAGKTDRNTLTRYLGGVVCKPTIKTGKTSASGTSFIICSDGVYKAFEDIQHFQSILNDHSDIQSKKDAVMQFALQNGPSDDKSFIMISDSI